MGDIQNANSEIEIVEKLPSVQKYIELREKVGWGRVPENAVKAALSNSVYGACAVVDGEVIGFARVIGDGGLCFYIQELVIDPEYQRQGIGSRFMEKIMAYFQKTLIDGAYIGVFVGKGLEEFYGRYGFWIRPTDNMGPGMMQFLNAPDVNALLSRRSE